MTLKRQWIIKIFRYYRPEDDKFNAVKAGWYIYSLSYERRIASLDCLDAVHKCEILFDQTDSIATVDIDDTRITITNSAFQFIH